MTERACQRTADLRGDTKRASVGFRNVDGFRLIPVLVPQQPLLRAISRLLMYRHSGPVQPVTLRETSANRDGLQRRQRDELTELRARFGQLIAEKGAR